MEDKNNQGRSGKLAKIGDGILTGTIVAVALGFAGLYVLPALGEALVPGRDEAPTEQQVAEAAAQQVAQKERQAEWDEIAENTTTEVIGAIQDSYGSPSCEIYKVTTTDGRVVLMTQGRYCRIAQIEAAPRAALVAEAPSE